MTVFELLRAFFRLGLVAFGGPAAHIGMMEGEFVERRKVLDRQEFLDLVGAANLIPGPNSTETAMHVGYRLGGWRGLLAAGGGFIVPAAALTLAVAVAYEAGRSLDAAGPFLSGIQAGVMAIIGMAVWKLGRKAAKTTALALLAASAAAANLLGAPEALVILAGGVLAAVAGIAGRGAGVLTPFALLWAPSVDPGQAFSMGKLFLVFLKTGALLFGSGYVLVAYLEGDLVEQLGWMSQDQLLDAIAMGQFTPGPVLTTATFIGYHLGSWQGAGLATLGIFLPSFLFVALTAPLVSRIRQSRWASAFLDGANAAAVGVMAAVLLRLGIGLGDWRAYLIAGLALVLLLRRPAFSPVLLVLGSAVLGFLLFSF